MDHSSPLLTLLEHQHAADGSHKFLWQLADGATVESISFTFRGQVYTCISSQVGCNVGCPFCATGQQRVLRNLSSEEMIAQVTASQAAVRAAGGTWPLDQVAFSGMGEPLLNFEAVIQAAVFLRSNALAPTVSLSISGIILRIYDLAENAE